MTNHCINFFFAYYLFSFLFAPPLYSQQINNQTSLNSSNLSIPTCGTITPPYIETFNDAFFYDINDPKSLDSCWFQTDFDFTDSIGSFNSTNFSEHKEWYKNGFANVSDTGAITLRVDDNSPNSLLLISPSIDMGSITDTFHLEFDLSFTDTAANAITTFGSNFGCTQTFQVLFSEDDGATWNTLSVWDDLIFDINNIPDFPSEHYVMMLRNNLDFSIFSGNIRLGFHFLQFSGFFPCSDVFDIHIDNFEISEDVVYSDVADIEPSLVGANTPILVNESYYRGLDEICVGIDTSGALRYAISNNGPFTSTLSSMAIIGNSDTVFYLESGPTTAGNGFQFFQDVEELCPGIFDSAYSCDVMIHMTSINPGDADLTNDTLIFQITSNNPPTYLNINSDTTICAGSPVQLEGLSDGVVTWKDGFGNTYSNGDLVSPTITTTYFATSGSQHCKLTDQFKITVIDENLEITHYAGTLTGTSGFDTYSWELDGNVISTTETVSLGAYGIYILTTTLNGCEYQEQYDHGNVGLNDLSESTLVIYPNPFMDKITIPIEFDCADIYNTTGQMIFSTQDKVVNLSSLSSGFYTIIIYTKDTTIKQKLMKM